MSRRTGLISLVAVAAIVGAVGAIWAYQYFTSDPCMDGSTGGGSCPTMADVNGLRYGVSVGLELIDIEDDLTAFGSMTRTNASEYFAETNVYSVASIDPTVLLIARAAPLDGDEGPYRMLSILHGNSDSIWPTFCRYLNDYRRNGQPECTLVPSP